jgi:hypothetical protein
MRNATSFERTFTDSQDNFIKGLVGRQDLSYSEITALFNVRFGTHKTRSSILGRAHRLGLSQLPMRKSVKTRNHFLKKKKRGAVDINKIVGTKMKNAGVSGYNTVHFDAPTNASKSQDALLHDDCRWPIDSDPIMFCAAPKSRGSYCAHHANIAFTVRPPRVTRR